MERKAAPLRLTGATGRNTFPRTARSARRGHYENNYITGHYGGILLLFTSSFLKVLVLAPDLSRCSTNILQCQGVSLAAVSHFYHGSEECRKHSMQFHFPILYHLLRRPR